MPPTDFEAVLAEHTRLADSGASLLHARLGERLRHIESRGRKRSWRNTTQVGDGDRGRIRLDMATAVSALRFAFTDYNAVEVALLFILALICVFGMMFTVAVTRSELGGDGGKSSIGGILLAILIVAVLYVAGVCAAEAVDAVGQAQETQRRRGAAQKRRGSSVKERDLATSSKGSIGASRAAAALFSVGNAGARRSLSVRSSRDSSSSGGISGPVEQGLNPLFASPNPVASAAAPNSSGGGQPSAQLRALISSSAVPSAEHWAAVRDHYARTAASLEAALAALAEERRKDPDRLASGEGSATPAAGAPSNRRVGRGPAAHFGPLKASPLPA